MVSAVRIPTLAAFESEFRPCVPGNRRRVVKKGVRVSEHEMQEGEQAQQAEGQQQDESSGEPQEESSSQGESGGHAETVRPTTRRATTPRATRASRTNRKASSSLLVRRTRLLTEEAIGDDSG